MNAPATDNAGFSILAAAARDRPPQVAIVLGSGMSAVARNLTIQAAVPFSKVPGLAAPAVAGHAGQLLLGEWAGRRALVFQGRLHYYEGHPWRTVAAPVHTAHALGARILLLTNAAGGIHDALGPGSFMVIRDHLDWTRPPFSDEPPPGRPSPYAPRLQHLLIQAAHDLGMQLHAGIYASVLGPSYETPAEIRALRHRGADAVGMSTAREILAGYERGMECAALSCITNRAAGLLPVSIQHSDVLTTVTENISCLAEIIERFLILLRL